MRRYNLGNRDWDPHRDIMGMPQADTPESALQYTHKMVENLQFAYELARQNLSERADAQALHRRLVFEGGVRYGTAHDQPDECLVVTGM